jgi:DNA-binding transcriptional ArsR family regulator
MEKQMPKRARLLACARLFRTCAHPVRIKIMQTLLRKPMYVYEIMARIKLSQAETSHHLRLLLQSGVVQNEREGKKIRYSVDPKKFDGIGDALKSLGL